MIQTFIPKKGLFCIPKIYLTDSIQMESLISQKLYKINNFVLPNLPMLHGDQYIKNTFNNMFSF